MNVQNMESTRSFNKVPNQFIITDDDGNRFFQSYDSTVAKIDKEGQITLDEETWDYSNTTRKYRNVFLKMDSKEIKKAINKGEIILANLN